MNSLTPDASSTTLRLAVKVTEGFCTLVDGSPLPRMKPGAKAELVISPWNIEDPAARAKLLNERRIAFLSAGTSVWARVKEDKISDVLKQFRQNRGPGFSKLGPLVEIRLTSDVLLVVRGDGRSALSECECKIPALPEMTCSSINEAYTRVSEAFEPSRRSHTGNIFNCVFHESGYRPAPLRELRDEKLCADDRSMST
jgi:hypothetical protein